jgi:AcrR family transcriptional regulator
MSELFDKAEISRPQRRRGPALGEALLAAAWDELQEHGYADFTMEGVARRAGTSRPVLSRRWANRAEMALGAIAYYLGRNPIHVPDLGNVRDELALLLRLWSERATPAPVRFMLDLRSDLAPAHGNLQGVRRDLAAQIGETDVMGDILRRGVARGELDAAKLSPRVISVPIDLARNEIFLTMSRLSDDAIAGILDEVFLPLVQRNAAG